MIESAKDKAKVFEYEWYRYDDLEKLVKQFMKKRGVVKAKVYDYDKNDFTVRKYDLSKKIMVIDGIFLFHPKHAINKLWDKKIYLDADLACFLNKMGAKIKGAGTPIITIEGCAQLSAVEYGAMSSRIETAFFFAAAAITKGELIVKNAILSNLGIVVDKMRQMGIEIIDLGANRVLARMTKRLQSISFTTWPYPGFPTDFQPQMMALMSVSQGTGIVKETVFENRFMHVQEFNRLGANIRVHLDEAVVTGVDSLKGAPVMASDLQAGAGLVLAALAAEGKSVIDRIYHIDRGYERIEERLTSIGASIIRFTPVKEVKKNE